MVEQEAVNFEVAGSSPVPGANQKPYGLFFTSRRWTRTSLTLGASPVPEANYFLFADHIMSSDRLIGIPSLGRNNFEAILFIKIDSWWVISQYG